MNAHALLSIAMLYEGWTYTVEQGAYNAHNFKIVNMHNNNKKTSCTIKYNTMDDRAWIREDTLTMQLAIPPDLRIYSRHIYNDEMAQSNWCNRMAKDA